MNSLSPNEQNLYLRLIILVSILVRILVGFFPFSGEATPPRFGDFEAQRHWKEVTVNLPIPAWYSYSPDWWPLDYPPLTAYHENMLGRIASWYEPAAVSLDTSRGYESEFFRTYMRLTVLVSDLLVYYPAAWFLSSLNAMFQERIWILGGLLLNPAIIFADHAHFQYNCVAMGFLLWAIFHTLRGRPLLAALSYTTSFLFKQTLLYFSLMFFAYLLGEACILRNRHAATQRVLLLGSVVLMTVAASLAPIISDCREPNCIPDRVSIVLKRVFPFSRGAFEDYVANAWVVFNPFLRIRGGSDAYLKLIGALSSICTFGASLLPCIALFRRPNPLNFATGLTAVGLAFYLFGWLVHEKAIVLPLTSLLAVSGGCLDADRKHRLLARMIEAAFFSLSPLMLIEGSCLAGFVCFAVASIGITIHSGIRSVWDVSNSGLNRIQLIFNLISLTGLLVRVSAFRWDRYPFLGELIIVTGSFGTFLSTLFYLTCILWNHNQSKKNV